MLARLVSKTAVETRRLMAAPYTYILVANAYEIVGAGERIIGIEPVKKNNRVCEAEQRRHANEVFRLVVLPWEQKIARLPKIVDSVRRLLIVAFGRQRHGARERADPFDR